MSETTSSGVECCRPTDAADPAGLGVAEAEGVAALLKAVADPVRLRLFSLIATVADSICVCDLQDVGVSQPTVSHHLRKLREAGLIDCERRGTWVHYWPTTRGLGVHRVTSALVADQRLCSRN